MPELCRPSHGHLSPSLRWGISADLKVGPFTAEAVCCANHRFAEEPHFWSQNAAFVAAAKAATEKNPLVFFDSACDVPLFKAPVGRNTSQWLEESAHGWPSFRSQEMVSENLVTFAGGEVQSRCGTHLGHNLPDAKGDRYCIDLVCIAGEEASVLAGKPSMQNSEFEVYFGCGRYLPSETIGNCRDCTNIYLDPAKGSDFFRRWSKKISRPQSSFRGGADLLQQLFRSADFGQSFL
ncbi:unnamed protein product [Durusdinium trenchii]|uniref:Uncharacterized protein n=1 Tax=Durusdinium trenchii TaxID=1381693 RepID=A0ABP0KBH2_9DINO